MMRTYVLLALLGVLSLYTRRVDGNCVSCAYQQPKTNCKDPYIPSGSEKHVCEGNIDGALCRKYNGGYTIYCESGGSTVTCSKKQTPCPSGAGQSQPLHIAVFLMSVFAAIATRF